MPQYPSDADRMRVVIGRELARARAAAGGVRQNFPSHQSFLPQYSGAVAQQAIAEEARAQQGGGGGGGPRAPDAPTALAAAPGNGSVSLSFTDGADGGSPIIDYWYSVNGGSFVSAGSTTLPIVVTGLNNGTAYTFVVQAENAVGRSPSSSPASGTPRTVPTQPRAIGVSTRSLITIYFTDPSSNGGAAITNYEYSINGGSSWTAVSPPQTTSPIYTNDIATPGITFDISLRAINAAGAGSASTQVSAKGVNYISPAGYGSGSIRLWLDNDVFKVDTSNNIVTRWSDSSLQGNNFTTMSPYLDFDTAGINNRPAIRFDNPTTGHYLQSTFAMSPTNEMSLFVVLNQTGNLAGNSEIFYTGDNYGHFDLFSETNSSNNLAFNYRSTTQRITPANIIGSTKYHIISLLISDNPADANFTGAMYLDGSGIYTNTALATGAYNISAAHDWRVSGGAFQGYIGEIIAYSTPLAASEREAVEGQLAWKWGLDDRLPSTHAFATIYPGPHTAPTITTITPGNSQLLIAFTPGNGTSITNYRYSLDGGAFTACSPATGAVSSFTISGLSNETTYSVRIQAVNASGASPASAAVSGTPSIFTRAVFTAVGNHTWTVPAGVTSVEYLVVGGGGGGGGSWDTAGAGGGGGGEVITSTLSVTQGDTINITVGGGGAGGTSSTGTATNGDDGNASTLTYGATTINAAGGGKGYVGGSNPSGGATGSGGIAPSGGNGSTGGDGGKRPGAGGGGGGAGGVGADGIQSSGTSKAAGGIGLTSTVYSGTYGAGGISGYGTNTAGPNHNFPGTSAASNTGNGGGGASVGVSSNAAGGAGGSGLVVIKYVT